MKAASLLSELRRRDIQVWVAGGQLHCAAKAGALTPELRDELRQRKNDILALLASAEALAAKERAIVPLQASGSRTPVFAVPGHNGDVFCYRALAQRLGENQPFFGLQPPGVDGREPLMERVEDIAAYLAEQIRAFYPRGRYIVAGYCAGGTIAFEVAQQLLRDGAEVRLLALFGSPCPEYFRLGTQLRLQVAQQAARLGGTARDLAARAPGAWASYFGERLRRHRERIDAQALAARDPVLAQRAKVERATLLAARAYRPRPYAGPVALLLPSAQWTLAQGWYSLAPRAREYHGPEGCSNQDMLREPNAGALAALFTDALEHCKMP